MKKDEAYSIARAFDKIEEQLIKSIMDDFEKHPRASTKDGAWQIAMLESLEEFRKDNPEQFDPIFEELNKRVEISIRKSYKVGNEKEQKKILRAIAKGYNADKESGVILAGFNKINRRKLNALLRAVHNDLDKAEHAILRRADDTYRQAIFDAQTFMNTGGATYEQAVNLATHDMLSAGLKCIVYKNGTTHRLGDYAEMAIRTANKRAYLQGEGDKRKEWGLSLVIVNQRTDACPLCMPYVGQVLIDDVYSDGKPSDGPYPLLSEAMSAGLYHPSCKDVHTTWFEGISPEPTPPATAEEIAAAEERDREKAKERRRILKAEAQQRKEKYELKEEKKEEKEEEKKDWK